jgi:hypothetical protein
MTEYAFLEYFTRRYEFTMRSETTEQKSQLSAEETIEHAKRALALKKYEQAVDYYATALELKYALHRCSVPIIRARLTDRRDQIQRVG